MTANEKDELIRLLNQVHIMHKEASIGHEVYIIEECDELIKECLDMIKQLTKHQRKRSNEREVVEEACDVITTILILLYSMAISEEYILMRVRYKLNRALEHYNKYKEN